MQLEGQQHKLMIHLQIFQGGTLSPIVPSYKRHNIIENNLSCVQSDLQHLNDTIMQ